MSNTKPAWLRTDIQLFVKELKLAGYDAYMAYSSKTEECREGGVKTLHDKEVMEVECDRGWGVIIFQLERRFDKYYTDAYTRARTGSITKKYEGGYRLHDSFEDAAAVLSEALRTLDMRPRV